MRRHAQTALLFLLGGMLLKLAATGAHVRYVRAGYAPLLVVAGVALLAVAAVNLWRDLRTDAVSRDDDTSPTGLQLDGLFGSDRQRAARTALETTGEITVGDHRDRALAAGRAAAAHEGLGESTATPASAGATAVAGIDAPTAVFGVVTPTAARTVSDPEPAAGPDRGGAASAALAGALGPAPISGPFQPRTVVGWPLLIAALAVVVLAPPALGSFPALRAGALTVAGAVSPLPDGDPVPMTLAEYAAHAAAGGSALAGRRVLLVGFVLAGPRGEPYLARLSAGCCAAGARPVKLGLTGDLPGVLTANSWLEVVGVYTDQVGRDPVSGRPIPFVSVVSVTEIEPPPDRYEH